MTTISENNSDRDLYVATTANDLVEKSIAAAINVDEFVSNLLAEVVAKFNTAPDDSVADFSESSSIAGSDEFGIQLPEMPARITELSLYNLKSFTDGSSVDSGSEKSSRRTVVDHVLEVRGGIAGTTFGNLLQDEDFWNDVDQVVAPAENPALNPSTAEIVVPAENPAPNPSTAQIVVPAENPAPNPSKKDEEAVDQKLGEFLEAAGEAKPEAEIEVLGQSGRSPVGYSWRRVALAAVPAFVAIAAVSFQFGRGLVESSYYSYCWL